MLIQMLQFYYVFNMDMDRPTDPWNKDKTTSIFQITLFWRFRYFVVPYCEPLFILLYFIIYTWITILVVYLTELIL